MPPKKHSNVEDGKESSSTSTSVEFEPPLASVRRILKMGLPSNANVGKDASSTFARACGIFVIYLTTCANDYAREQKRQTITANDVLAAMKELDFDEFTPQLETFLKQYRADEQSKKDAKQAAKNLVGKKLSTTVADNVKVSAEEKDEGTANQSDVKEPEAMNVDGAEEKGATAVPQEGDSDMHVDEAKTDQENQSIEMED